MAFSINWHHNVLQKHVSDHLISQHHNYVLLICSNQAFPTAMAATILCSSESALLARREHIQTKYIQYLLLNSLKIFNKYIIWI